MCTEGQGENLTTVDIDLLGLPLGTLLNIGAVAQLCITGLRNPCKQLDDYRPGVNGRSIRARR